MSLRRPFGTLLVANRGEIALRVIRTARAMGLTTVAVHSDADRDAPHVAAAHRAVAIGPAPAAESYLSIPAILDAARLSGAEAVHPGYGFLSENADFAEACAAAGLVFVGPRPETIRRMGDKAAAKAAMAEAGLPCLPGADAPADADPDALLRGVGLPLMVKAVAGGGGRGMRLVTEAGALAAALRAARSEAEAAFGDGRLMVERALVDPRHVEVQVFGDAHGNAIHLGERDCSIQRRNQKLVEEAPSPAVDAALRARMGAAAADAARALGYEGAGTFEFLLDAEGAFWFMEMNTRLQVEHPVTEALTGLDLVALQLRVAAGEPLPLTQDAVRLAGHAIEVRVCAESVDGFVPQSGRLERWQVPPGLRADAGVVSGSTVPPHYDSMLAKLVAHGPDRDTARRRLLAGLHDTVALGIETNLPLLARCLAHPVFAAGQATTAFLDRHADALADPPPDPALIRRAAALLVLTDAHAPRGMPAPVPQPRFARPVRLEIRGIAAEVDIAAAPDGALLAADAAGESRLRAETGGDDGIALVEDGMRRRIALLRRGDILEFSEDGIRHRVRDLSLVPMQAAAAAGRVLTAPMAGLLRDVHVAEGAEVAPDAPLMVLEAMKMEHELRLPEGGRVAEIAVRAGTQVSAGQVLLRLADPETPAESTAGEGANRPTIS